MSQQSSLTHRHLANALRVLSIDAVQRANSGHPGMPMGMADIAEVLWRSHLKHSPKNPKWFDRDRFVLSNGHGSMLLYGLLHLSGYDLPMQELQNFRQMDSKTPGHPEYEHTPGVETTTGPLGQGIANAVGMALSEKMLAATFNHEDHEIVDHHTYVFCGDGCLMEGVSHEACSLAGTWKLGKLVLFWDDNGISIDGKVAPWFSTDVPARFKAYGWHVIADVDGHDHEAINQAIIDAKANTDQPTIICCKTHIGFGSPNKVDTAGAHGAPLGDDEIALVREQLNWPHAPFDIPKDVADAWNAIEPGHDAELLWNARFAAYESELPALATEFLRRMHGFLPEDFNEKLSTMIDARVKAQKKEATRKASGAMIGELAAYLPELLGGSADLGGSNCTSWKTMTAYTPQTPKADYINYGVREFGMSAIMNGVALHKGLVPFAGTFLVFSDYARNAVRMSALMGQRVVYVYTHDSIGLGEDGPTHQPVEHASSLRLIPGLNVWRPADSTETAIAWQMALEYQGPSALLLTRQNVPPAVNSAHDIDDVRRGAYILHEPKGALGGIFIATGSEVELAMQATEKLAAQGVYMRVISMPCMDVFLEQEDAYREHVLPSTVDMRIAIEAGSAALWYRFVGPQGCVLGVNDFGISAPYQEIYETLGLTVDALVNAALLCQQTKKD
jgi:transketolase